MGCHKQRRDADRKDGKSSFKAFFSFRFPNDIAISNLSSELLFFFNSSCAGILDEPIKKVIVATIIDLQYQQTLKFNCRYAIISQR
jgi:hypothetical protein